MFCTAIAVSTTVLALTLQSALQVLLPRRCVALGTTHGRVAVFDVRAKPKKSVDAVYRGISGAVQQVATTSRQPNLAYSVALDRYLRVHDVDTKQTIHKVTRLGFNRSSHSFVNTFQVQ